MKPAAAFAVGLWTGALVTAAVGVFYVRVFGVGQAAGTTSDRQELETRIQILQQEHTNSTAEVQRLRQTVAELQSAAHNPEPSATTAVAYGARPAGGMIRRTAEPEIPQWILDAVTNADSQALPKLEQSAEQNEPLALDALALLADLDNADALTRAWSAASLTAANRARATVLLAATVELNPHGEEYLMSLTSAATENAALIEAALFGLETPGFSSRLIRGTGAPAPPLFKPDYNLRLRIVDALRAAITDEQLQATADRVRVRIAQRVADTEAAPMQ